MQFLLLIKTSFSILALNVEPIIDLEINSSLICISFFSFITANLAEVPVPHGDRSSFPGRITTVFKPVRIEFFDNNFETSSISISEVRCSPDLKIATVYVISIKNEKSENFVELLNQHKKEFRYQLGKNLNLKFTPEIRFVKDISIDQMLKTERLIESTKK